MCKKNSENKSFILKWNLINMVEKIVHRIRILHHIKRHHRAYILWWFSIFAIIQTVSFLSGIFSKASYEEAIMPEVQQEDSIDFLELEKAFMDEISGDNKENKEIYNTVFQFFGGWNEESDDPPLDWWESNDDRIPPTTTISGGVPDTRINWSADRVSCCRYMSMSTLYPVLYLNKYRLCAQYHLNDIDCCLCK